MSLCLSFLFYIFYFTNILNGTRKGGRYFRKGSVYRKGYRYGWYSSSYDDYYDYDCYRNNWWNHNRKGGWYTKKPTKRPTYRPTKLPTSRPSKMPIIKPSKSPIISPSNVPSILPSILPTISPSIVPSMSPSFKPSMSPTSINDITASPTKSTDIPSNTPSKIPSDNPTTLPSNTPSTNPIIMPSITPSNTPTILPSITPSISPSISPVPTEPISLTCSMEGLYAFVMDNTRVELNVCQSDMDNTTFYAGLSWQHSISNQIYTYGVSRIIGDDDSATGPVYILGSADTGRTLTLRCSREQGSTGPPTYELQIQLDGSPINEFLGIVDDISNTGSPEPWCFKPNGTINNGIYPQFYQQNININPSWLLDSSTTGCYINPIRSNNGGSLSNIIYPNEWNNMLRIGEYSVDGSITGSFVMVLLNDNEALISYSDGMNPGNDGNRYISGITFNSGLTCPLNT